MLTCYINNYSTNKERDAIHDNFKMFSILVLPLFYIISSIFLFVRLYKSRAAIKINESKKEIYKFLAYALIYSIFYFPTIILYLATISKEIKNKDKGDEPTFLSYFAYFCFISNVSLNFVLSVLRIFQGHISIDLISNNEETNNDFFPDSMSIDESRRSYSINYKKINHFSADNSNDVIVEIDDKNMLKKELLEDLIIKEDNFNFDEQFKIKNKNDINNQNIIENHLGRNTSKTVSNASYDSNKIGNYFSK